MITANTLTEVTKRLVQAYNPVWIYLFGSYAWGSPTEDSDLDLAIVVDESQKKSHQRPLAGYDALFGMGISKDIIVYTRAEFETASQNVTTLGFKIKQSGKLIYART